MDNSNVYVWRPEATDPENFDGSLDVPFQILVFQGCKLLKEAYLEWREKKGVKSAIAGRNKNKEFTDRCKTTVKWVERGCLDPIKFHIYLKESLEKDVFETTGYVPYVSQKVVDILKKTCPDEFEAFPLSITNFDTDKKFYILNLTEGIYGDEFLKNGMGKLSICRLIKKEEYRNDPSKILISEDLLNTFKAENVRTLRELRYGENPYAK